MTELIIEPTSKTPQIELNNFTGELIFSGKSIPENAARVYEPVFNWISGYIQNPNPTTNLRLNLEYYNTATVIWLTKIIKTLLRINDPRYTVIIHIYLSVEDLDSIADFDDIKDAFVPVGNIDYNQVPAIGIKLYGLNDEGEIVKDTLVFIELEQFTNLR